MKYIKIFLSLVILALSITANAQDTLKNATKTDTSATYLIKLNDNTSLSGKILESNAKEIVFNEVTIGKVTIPREKINKMTRLSGGQMCILSTNDGKSFTGIFVSQDEQNMVIKTESLGELTIPNSKIRDIKLIEREQIINGRFYFANPHPTRYFFGPSAIPMVKGEGYYQNAYVLANSVQVGVSDHFSMGGGIVIPFMFFITPKFGYKVAENVYLGGGILAATTISSDIPFGIGIGYGTVTLGNKEGNFTINAGWGGMKERNYTYDSFGVETSTNSWNMAKRPMFSVSGMVRAAPRVALITENWFFATKEYKNDYYADNNYTYKYRTVLSFGFRLMGERNSFDLAVAIPAIEGSTMGLPYLDYVFKF